MLRLKETRGGVVLLGALLGMSLLAGCGDSRPPTYSAGGTVTLDDGTPLAGGRVTFELCDDRLAPNARARIQPDGSFQLGTYDESDGALEGEHRVMGMPLFPPLKRGGEAEMQKGSFEPDPRTVTIDPRYRSFETSGLKFRVTSDPQKNHFEIKVK